MRPLDAEIDRVEERLLHRASREERERVARHGAVVAGAVDCVVERPMAAHDRDGPFEISLLALAPDQRARPEFALLRVAAAEGQHDRQGDLALPEIVADVLSELLARAAVVE